MLADMCGLEVGDKVKIINPELNYGDHIGTITANCAPEILKYQTQFVQVTFDFNGNNGSQFIEYFTPDELRKID